MGDSTILPSVPYNVRKVKEAGYFDQTDLIVREKAITIYVNFEELATVVCSPSYLVYMAVGFLCSEGILRNRQDLKDITVEEDKGLVYVEVNEYEQKLAGKVFLKRYITPCCGRSRASFYFSTDALLCKTVVSDVRIPASKVRSLAEELEERSKLFRRTGGVHSAALAVDDEILIFQEDIGRHNTLDKIMGQCFLDEIPFDDKVIIFSGRVSSEILLKAAKMGVPILVSRSAPTDLALNLAEDLGITVVGFARGEKFNIYTHRQRVLVGGDLSEIINER
jgi:FdhD protein